MTQNTDINQINIASLYVGDLKPEVNEQTLWNVFTPFGQILSIKVCRDSTTHQSLGYGYVNFRTLHEAEKAMEQVNFALIDGKPCRVMWSMRDANKRKLGIGNLFIKNIDPMLDSKSLYQAFSAFGPVLSCKIAIDEYGLSKGYGFIQFYNEADADKARLRSDGVAFMKKKLVVAKFIPRAARTDAKPIDPSKFTNIFVKNFETGLSLADFEAMFSKFGKITSCVIQTDDDGKSLGYGFVNYADSTNAAEVVAQMNGLVLANGEELFVSKAMKKLERQAFLRKQYEVKKQEYYKQFQNLNLYVKNFDETVSDEKLAEIFSKFGKIRSARIMKDDSGKSKCFGFVCYSTPEEALTAIEAMHSTVIDEKPLYVAIAQSREERRKYLEHQNYANTFRPSLFGPGSVPFMYPHPGNMTYAHPGQFNRFPQGVSNRPQNRQMQSMQAPHMSGYQQGGRQSYNNYQNSSYSHGGVRHRSNMGNVRHSHQNYYGNRSQMQVAQPAVNHVVTENVPRSKREEAKIPQKPQGQQSADFQNRVYHISQDVFSAQKYDMSLLPKVTGVVAEHFSTKVSHDTTRLSDDFIVTAVINAYTKYSETQKFQEV